MDLFRQPATFLLIASSIACTILTPLAVSHQLGQQTHLAVDSALAFELLFGIILTGYAACFTLHNECRSGTILIIFSKPVGRLMFFLAKFTAIALLLIFFIYCSALATLLAERLTPRNFELDALGLRLLLASPFLALIPAALLNYLTRRAFVPTALCLYALALTALVLILSSFDRTGSAVEFGSMMEWRLISASLLEGIALLMLATIAISLSARFAAPATVAILGLFLFTGLIAGHLTALLAHLPPVAFALKMALPDIQSFWPADKLADGGRLPLPLIGHATLYALLYGAGILGLGYTAFRNRQF